MKLTKRECQIMSLLAHDLSAKQIASDLNRSTHTIIAQIKSAKLKLNCYTAHGAVAKYLSDEFDRRKELTN